MKNTTPFGLSIALAAILANTPALGAQCFTMYDARNNVVLQSATTPIDLSRAIGSEMAAHFPGRALVISDVGTCTAYAPGSANASASAGRVAPMASLSATEAADLVVAKTASSTIANPGSAAGRGSR
jgi:hypothetical protein